MLLNQTAQYALRAMAVLAGERDAIASAALSEKSQVPSHYLSKIMRRMVLAGLVSSSRGHGGGFRLSREAQDVRFLDVLEAVDSAPTQGVCAFGLGNCDEIDPCRLHPAWSEFQDHFFDWATRTTLADVA